MRTRTQSKPCCRCHDHAFTLVEVLITIVTAVFIMGGAMAAYLYGLKMLQFVEPKLTASDDARRAVSLLTEDIRTAYDVKIGNRTGNAFSQIAPFTLQKGNAIRISPSRNTNQFVIYFWDSNDNKLKRTENNATFSCIVASSVSNALVFTAEDFKGNILSNNINNYVVGLTLTFYQIQYPAMAVGPGNYYDWYQLQCKVTKRNLF
jgi:hypothetical protein